MMAIDREVLIEAPIELIFDYVSDPRNLPEFWSSLIKIKDVECLPNSGYSARWLYKMAGMYFSGTAEYSKISPNSFFVIKTKGDIKSTITWTFRSRENITRVTLTIEYKIPIPLLGKLAEAIILKINAQEADLMMANLQARFSEARSQNCLSRLLLHR